MQKILRTLMVAAIAVSSLTTTAAAGIQDFIVRNLSGNSVFFVYVSPDYSDSWEEDVLGNDVLMPGNETDILMNGYGDHCWFDIKIEDEVGNVSEFFDVDLCTVLYVDFY